MGEMMIALHRFKATRLYRFAWRCQILYRSASHETASSVVQCYPKPFCDSSLMYLCPCHHIAASPGSAENIAESTTTDWCFRSERLWWNFKDNVERVCENRVQENFD